MHATLVDAKTLAANVDQASWRVFDCRHRLDDPEAGGRLYLGGHVPGAFFLHLDRDLSGPKDGQNGRHPLPDPKVLAARLVEFGVSARTQIVAYDDLGGMFASRLWWLLRWLGHEAVAVLDGGIQAWQAGGGRLTSGRPPMPVAGRLVEATSRGQPVVTVETLVANLGQPNFQVIDARSPDRYRGENETLDPVGGHIPGARNRFFRDNFDASGSFKPVGELRREWAEFLGDTPADAVIHQCGSGVTACVNLLAMEHAGMCGSRLYAGSWSEWCADPGRPVARR